MTRTVLSPIPASAHNPDVSPPRPGYAVYDPAGDRFACEPEDATAGGIRGYGWAYGWTGPRGAVKVWGDKASAEYVAGRMRCQVTTVPRCNGACWEWEVAA